MDEPPARTWPVRMLLTLLVGAACAALSAWTLWAVAALAIDLPQSWAAPFLAGVFVAVVAGLLVRVQGRWRKALAVALVDALVTAWWLAIPASNERAWQPDVAVTPAAQIDGDIVTLHGVRDCVYRSETDYDPVFTTRTVRLSKLTGVDLFLCYWGSEWLAHPFLSFQFEDARPVCISIETRKEIGEGYSALRGFFRQFELVYVLAEERDLVRVRTQYRQGEDVYLFKTTVPAERARTIFLDYLLTVEDLRQHPRWYNALTTNCTTGIRMHFVATARNPAPWDWRILLPGKADELFHMKGGLVPGVPLAELKERGHVNPAANAAGRVDDFPRLIRRGVPGFGG